MRGLKHGSQLYSEGANRLEAGDLGGAAEVLTQATELLPSHAGAHTELGLALHLQGRLSEAMNHYSRAMQLDRNRPDAFNHMGNALGQLGRYRDAIEVLAHSLELDPSYAPTWMAMAAAHDQLGELESAVKLYREAARLASDPDLQAQALERAAALETSA